MKARGIAEFIMLMNEDLIELLMNSLIEALLMLMIDVVTMARNDAENCHLYPLY